MRFPLDYRNHPRLPYRAIVFLLGILFTGFVLARPDMTPLGPNIADKGSAYYHFTINTFDSADGKRHYKVWTGVPKKDPPAAGYPVLWMLDGNAVMNHLSDTLLGELSAGTPPVIVAVGYQTDLPFDLYARSWDDTPPIPDSDNQTIRGRKGGGSADFQQLIVHTIAPKAEKGIAIDSGSRGIWGHSLGGIFALDSYYSQPFFTRSYATSPTLNQNYIGLLTRLKTADSRRLTDKQLLVVEGSWPVTGNPQAPEPETLNKVRETLKALNARGISARLVQFPDLSHGQTFTVGFELALRNMAGEK